MKRQLTALVLALGRRGFCVEMTWPDEPSNGDLRQAADGLRRASLMPRP